MSNTRPVLVGINGRKAVVRVKNEEPEEDADNLFDDFSVDHDERNEAGLVSLSKKNPVDDGSTISIVS
jgi:hypothetical protein